MNDSKLWFVKTTSTFALLRKPIFSWLFSWATTLIFGDIFLRERVANIIFSSFSTCSSFKIIALVAWDALAFSSDESNVKSPRINLIDSLLKFDKRLFIESSDSLLIKTKFVFWDLVNNSIKLLILLFQPQIRVWFL